RPADARRDRDADRDVVARFRLDDLRGLPPNLPVSREDAAFRLDLTEPRHAGQNDTKSIRWVGHFGIAIPPKRGRSPLYSNVLGSFLQWGKQFGFLRASSGSL